MKRPFLIISLILICVLRTYSQNSKSEFEIIKSIFNTEKRSYFEQYMNLTPDEEKVFWPIYEDYEIARSKFARKRIDALKLFVDKYETMSENEAKNFMNDIFSIQKQDLKVRKKYFNLLSSKLSAKKAFRFIQIDEYINAMIKQKILEKLPFIKD